MPHLNFRSGNLSEDPAYGCLLALRGRPRLRAANTECVPGDGVAGSMGAVCCLCDRSSSALLAAPAALCCIVPSLGAKGDGLLGNSGEPGSSSRV